MTTRTILIADDSLVVRAVVRSGLEDEGYRVIEAVDGLAALEQCRQDPPDVILLDIEMPGLDGYEVLAELKCNAHLKDIPVVFLTSRSGMDDVVAGLRGGAHDYLKKPFEAAELLARVGSAFHIKKLQDQLQQRNAELDRISRTDGLTGLFNRRHLDEELARRNTDSLRHGEAICVLLLDLDHFKHINDAYGHPAGDLVLRAFADRISARLAGWRHRRPVGWRGIPGHTSSHRSWWRHRGRRTDSLCDRSAASDSPRPGNQRKSQRRLRSWPGRFRGGPRPTCRPVPLPGEGFRPKPDRRSRSSRKFSDRSALAGRHYRHTAITA